MKIITVTTIKYYQYFKTCACQHAVTTHVGSRVPDVKLPKKKTIHATKEPYPRVRPCFLTSQRFPDLLLITELHVTIVRLSHGTCSTPLSLCAKTLQNVAHGVIKSPGDYVKPCKISRPHWINPCFKFY